MKNMKKHQNNKTWYGVEAFPKNNMLLFHTLQNLMFHTPLVLPKMITLKQSYDQFKFKW
jgi:hypothetical protein